MPVTDLLCTNSHTDPSDTSEPCVEHKDKRNKPPELLNELLTHISNGGPIGMHMYQIVYQ